MKRNITAIKFWKRSAQSIEETQEVNLKYENGSFDIVEKNITLSKEESDQIISTLLKDIDINSYDESYLGYKYEDDKNNFSFRFLLSISFDNATYIIIKGIKPFGQPHYKEILNLFSKYL
jgi:hypothetical protein